MIFEDPEHEVTRRFVKSQALLLGGNGIRTNLVLQFDRPAIFVPEFA